MKRGAFGAAVLGACFVLAATPAFARAFVNATGEWEFRYPSELLIQESSATEWSLANFSLGRPRDLRDGQFRMDFTIDDAEGLKSVEKLTDNLCEEKSDSGLEATECDTTTIEGKTWARVLRGGGRNEDTELVVATAAGGKLFQSVAMVADGDEEAENLGEVEAIVDSFEVSPSGAPVDAAGGGGVARTGSETIVLAIVAGLLLAIGVALRTLRRFS